MRRAWAAGPEYGSCVIVAAPHITAIVGRLAVSRSSSQPCAVIAPAEQDCRKGPRGRRTLAEIGKSNMVRLWHRLIPNGVVRPDLVVPKRKI